MICVLRTNRLLLRPFNEGDLDDLVQLFREESVWKYPLGRAMTDEETARFLQRRLAENLSDEEPALHATIELSTGRLAGYVGLSVPHFLPEVLPAVEVGWRLGENFRGRGIATEAATATLQWGFDDLQLNQIISIFEPDNFASGRVMDHLGFTHLLNTTDPTFAVPLELAQSGGQRNAW